MRAIIGSYPVPGAADLSVADEDSRCLRFIARVCSAGASVCARTSHFQRQDNHSCSIFLWQGGLVLLPDGMVVPARPPGVASP